VALDSFARGRSVETLPHSPCVAQGAWVSQPAPQPCPQCQGKDQVVAWIRRRRPPQAPLLGFGQGLGGEGRHVGLLGTRKPPERKNIKPAPRGAQARTGTPTEIAAGGDEMAPSRPAPAVV
jgi:hypothetical protein